MPKNWVFIRGLAREKGHWGDFPEFFSRQFPNSHIEAIDLPGIGDNADISSPTSIARIMELVRDEALEKFNDEKFAVLAVSLGAMIAMEWMKQHPNDLEAAVLINSSAKGSALYKRLRYQIWPQFITMIANTTP